MALEIERNQRLQCARDVASKGGTVTLISSHCDSHHRNGDRGPKDPLDHAAFGMLWKRIGRVGDVTLDSQTEKLLYFLTQCYCVFLLPCLHQMKENEL